MKLRTVTVLVVVVVTGLAQEDAGPGSQVESPRPSRRYPDRSQQYVRRYEDARDKVQEAAGRIAGQAQAGLDTAREAVSDAARSAAQQLPWANSSLGYQDQDPGAIFRQYARQRDELENPTTTTTTARPETTTIRRPGVQQGGQQQQQQSPQLGNSGRDPFDDPNRYIEPQIQDITQGVRYVNGIPYRETSNIKDRYGNRYDPRSHSIPGQYDPVNDPRFSDPNFLDPRNLPKYDTNLQHVPKDRYDTKYRYYERFPDRQRDKLRDPNYDPRWDAKEPHANGVLGGWLPELQGECRPGCENLPRDVTVNTNYGRVNGFYVYLYDGPRVPLYEVGSSLRK